jgi:hypothetical protein
MDSIVTRTSTLQTMASIGFSGPFIACSTQARR